MTSALDHDRRHERALARAPAHQPPDGVGDGFFEARADRGRLAPRARRGTRFADLAHGLRDQLRGWDDAGLAAAIGAVARADADVKGQEADNAYSLERMVLTVTAARRG